MAKKILLTKAEAKRARKRWMKRKKMSAKRDRDGDGTPDRFDGYPNDPKRHSFVGGLITGIGTQVGASVARSITKRQTAPRAGAGLKRGDGPVTKKLDKINPFRMVEKELRKKRRR